MTVESIDQWKKKQESQAMFEHREGSNIMAKFVDVGKANRINTAEQSMLLTSLRMLGLYMEWDWVKNLCDFVEDYQTTCGDPHAAREMLLEAVQFDRLAEHQRNKSSIILGTDGKDGK